MAGIIIERIEVEVIPIETSSTGKSFGWLVDEQLAKHVRSNQRVQRVSVDLSENDWEALVTQQYGQSQPVAEPKMKPKA